MTTQPVDFQTGHVKISAGWTLLGYLARKLGRLAYIVARSPAKLATLLPLAVIWWLNSIATWLAAGFALLCVTIAAAWATQFPTSYQHHIAGRIRGTWRSARYRWHWSKWLKDCGVTLTRSNTPLLLRTNSTKVFDRLTVRMTPGQRPEDWANRTDRLTQTFGALNCRITTTNKPHWLQLLFLTQAASRAHHVIDMPTDLTYYGPCPDCSRDIIQERIHRDDQKTPITCRYPSCEYVATLDEHQRKLLIAGEDRWLTVGELVSAITSGGEVVTRAQIDGWIERGGLAREKRVRPRYVNGDLTTTEVWTYRLGDVRDRAAAAFKRKQDRAANAV